MSQETIMRMIGRLEILARKLRKTSDVDDITDVGYEAIGVISEIKDRFEEQGISIDCDRVVKRIEQGVKSGDDLADALMVGVGSLRSKAYEL